MKGRLRRDAEKNLVIDLEITNQTGSPMQDFDIMFNKNPFGVSIAGVTNKIVYPANGGSVSGTL